METVVLAFVILVLLADRAWTTRQWAIERRKMLDTVIARTPQELTILRSQDTAKPDEGTWVEEGFLGQVGL